MFEIHDVVMYGNSGLCKIVDIQKKKFINNEMVLYYVLQPIRDAKTTIYAPVNSNKIEMRTLISADEINELIQKVPEEKTVWINNDQQRRGRFQEIIKNGNHMQLIQLIKTLYLNKEEKRKAGKTFRKTDEDAMKEAEKLLYEEFAYVLNIDYNEVAFFIFEKLQLNSNQQ